MVGLPLGLTTNGAVVRAIDGWWLVLLLLSSRCPDEAGITTSRY